jgi:hypothetical protein
MERQLPATCSDHTQHSPSGSAPRSFAVRGSPRRGSAPDKYGGLTGPVRRRLLRCYRAKGLVRPRSVPACPCCCLPRDSTSEGGARPLGGRVASQSGFMRHPLVKAMQSHAWHGHALRRDASAASPDFPPAREPLRRPPGSGSHRLDFVPSLARQQRPQRRSRDASCRWSSLSAQITQVSAALADTKRFPGSRLRC